MKILISLITATLLCAAVANAQQSGKTSFGLRGGVNLQTINGKTSSDVKLKNDILVGFNIGINAEIPIAPSFYFQPGLLFTVKGAKNEDVFLGQTINSTTKINYAELPLNFIYKPTLGKGNLLLGFGPYVALGVGGKATYEGGALSRDEDIEFKNDVKVADANDVTFYKPFDAGANLLAGYEFSNKISFQLNAQLGLIDINPTYEGFSGTKATARNTGFGLSIGYRF